ncbi:hypothetical protein ACQI4E_26010 [Streptomyces sp. CA-252508]|uniref:hypothetical protein n=1 Tax=Streptomyces sp. CA-252508 TaxID=3418946 RepID=UPI003D8FDCB8
MEMTSVIGAIVIVLAWAFSGDWFARDADPWQWPPPQSSQPPEDAPGNGSQPGASITVAPARS